MRLSAALLVPLLLVTAGATAPVTVGADDAPDETFPRLVVTNESANYVAVPDDRVSQRGTSHDDLSLETAIAADTYALRGTHAHNGFERSFRAAGTQSNQTAAIRAAVDGIAERHERLERRNRNLIRGFANASVSAAAFTRERARIHAQAADLQTTIDHVDRVARSDDGYSYSTALRTRVANLSGELEVLQGPVSNHTAAAVGGGEPGRHVYAEASTEGYTIAYVTDDSYVRETYLGSERDENASDSFDDADVPRGNAARLRGHKLYTWVVNNSVSPNIYGLGRSGIYRFTADFTDGQLTAYIDGGTTNVFRESQRHKLSAVPVSNTVANANGTLRLQVNKTYETGPMELSLVRNDTGAPVDGTVTVDDERVGTTGSDGTTWIVEPSGPDRIEATTSAGENVSVFLPS